MTTQTMEKATKKIKMEISRENGTTYFHFEIDPKIEEVFKKASAGAKKDSNSWPGLKFYEIPHILEDGAYQRLLYKYNLRDDFGKKIYASGQFNIAFLRTVGGKGKIKVDNIIPFAQVSEGVKNIISFVKEFYEDFLKDYKVRGLITFEV